MPLSPAHFILHIIYESQKNGSVMSKKNYIRGCLCYNSQDIKLNLPQNTNKLVISKKIKSSLYSTNNFKSQYLLWPPLIFSTALTLLGKLSCHFFK